MAFGLSDFSSGLNSLLRGNKKPAIAKQKEATDDVVAGVIAKHTSAKATQIKDQLKVDTERIASEERQIKQKQQTLSTLVRSKTVLEEKYKSMTAKKKAELIAEYKDIILKLKTHPLVNKFSVDTHNRVIVTTHSLPVKKPTWKRSRLAGIYQIKIDFAQTAINNAIHILNCTQRQDGHDSPTISNTSPCWGNISTDITNDFKTQDLYELVIDLMDYIMSPNDNDGYITGPGATTNDKKGWEAFFNKAKKMPEGYSFEQWDKEHHSENSFGGGVLTAGVATGAYTVDYGGLMSTTSGVTLSSLPSIGPFLMNTSQWGQLQNWNTNRSQLTVAQQDLARELERYLYLRPNSARHYAELLYPHEGVQPITRIEISADLQRSPMESRALSEDSLSVDFSGGVVPSVMTETVTVNDRIETIKMYVTREANTSTAAPPSEQEDLESRFFLNTHDFTSEGEQRLRHERRFMYRPRYMTSDARRTEYQAREQMVRNAQSQLNQLSATQAAYENQLRMNNPYYTEAQQAQTQANLGTGGGISSGVSSGIAVSRIGNATGAF